MNNVFGNLFGRIAPGLCRLGVSGGIAVKTSSGYKSYNVKTGRLTNCDNFVFPDVSEDFFFVVPTNKVAVGDIILVNGKPKCVIEAEKNKITVINYEDSTIDNIIPERHVILGNTYYYGKIVSIFGGNPLNGEKGTNKIMKYLMMTEMMKGFSGGNSFGSSNNGMSAMLPLMMLGNVGMDNLFSDMFNFDFDVTDDEEGEAEEKPKEND